MSDIHDMAVSNGGCTTGTTGAGRWVSYCHIFFIEIKPFGGSHNRWFTMENPIKIDDLEIQHPYFTKPPCVLLAFNLLATSQTCPCPLHFRYQNYGTYHG
jgi:hypothetical protein